MTDPKCRKLITDREHRRERTRNAKGQPAGLSANPGLDVSQGLVSANVGCRPREMHEGTSGWQGESMGKHIVKLKTAKGVRG